MDDLSKTSLILEKFWGFLAFWKTEFMRFTGETLFPNMFRDAEYWTNITNQLFPLLEKKKKKKK